MKARVVALAGIVSILAGGIVSALRHEEIYLICSAAWLMEAANVLQQLGLVSWSLGVLLAFVFFAAAFCLLASPLVFSALILFLPSGRVLLRMAAWAYFALAFVIGGALFLILTDDRLGSVLKNAPGPRLSACYIVLPVLFSMIGLLFYRSRLSSAPQDF